MPTRGATCWATSPSARADRSPVDRSAGRERTCRRSSSCTRAEDRSRADREQPDAGRARCASRACRWNRISTSAGAHGFGVDSGSRARRRSGRRAWPSGSPARGCSQDASRRAVASANGWARGIEGQRKADLGNGTFLNPIMAGDHPDPSILKDGDDYYMTFSSFDAYPGLVIWHSRDLVNWQPIGPTLFKNVGSVWAPGSRQASRAATTSTFPGIAPNRSNYVIWADNIRGPWSEPIDLKLTRIDPGHAVGPDGQPLPVPERRRAGAACRRRAVDDGRAEEDLRRLEVSRPTGSSRRFAQEGPEDPEARRLLLHGARRRRHRGSADRPHGRGGAIEDHRRAVGELALQPDPAHAIAATSAGGRRATARSSRTAPASGGWSITPTRTATTRSAARRCSSRSSGRPTAGSAWPAPIRPRRSRSRRASAGPHGFAFSDDFSKPKMGVQWSFYAGDASRSRALSLREQRAGPERRRARARPTARRCGSSTAITPTKWKWRSRRMPTASGGLLVFYSRKLYAGLGFSAQQPAPASLRHGSHVREAAASRPAHVDAAAQRSAHRHARLQRRRQEVGAVRSRDRSVGLPPQRRLRFPEPASGAVRVAATGKCGSGTSSTGRSAVDAYPLLLSQRRHRIDARCAPRRQVAGNRRGRRQRHRRDRDHRPDRRWRG